MQEKQKFSQVFGIEPFENYGLSETTFISSERSHGLALRREGGVGSVMPDIDFKLSEVDVDGMTLNEILVRTPFMMLGYLDKQGRLELPIDEDGFFRSGDYGRVADGQLIITGRRRDIIKKGGILIPLREIELVAEGIDGILEAAAVRLDHPFYGESYEIYIRANQPVADEKIFVDHFSSQIHELLARHKWPERILICNDFPRTASGKVQKHLLNEKEVKHG
jgi:acyl-CoA synthetase (AMP-forming)/AMP-acid ligase II